MITTAITPDDLEFVPTNALAPGDIVVSFTALNVNIDIPATPRQLRAKRTMWRVVVAVNDVVTSRGVPVLSIVTDTDSSGSWWSMPTTRMWRVQRDRLHLITI